jgi:sugar lactone lactonase YvrE
MAGNLEFLGLNVAWSINLLSILSLVAMLTLVTVLGEILFHSRTVGRIAASLFFFNTSLAYIPFLRSQKSFVEAIQSVVQLRNYLPSGYPFRGEDWGPWTLNIFTNQRHIASGIGVLLVVLIFLLDRYQEKYRSSHAAPEEGVDVPHPAPEKFGSIAKGFVFSGILIGMLPLWNGPVYAAAGGILACLFVLFPYRPYMVLTAITSALAGLPQLLYWKGGDSGLKDYPIFHWGYVVDQPTFKNVLEYLGFTFGIKWALLLAAFFMISWFQWRFFIAALSFMAIAFLVQFNIEVFANHKFLHIWLILMNLFAAYTLWRMGRRSVLGRMIAIVITVAMTLGGVIDLFPIHNDGARDYAIKSDPLIQWVRTETNPKDIFLTDMIVQHQILLAGRKIFYGWPYYAWGAGYPTLKREKIYRAIYEGTDPAEVIRLLNENHISFVAIDDGLRHNQTVRNLNESVFQNYFEKVFEDSDNKYGDLTLYKVPNYEEWRKELTPEQAAQIKKAYSAPHEVSQRSSIGPRDMFAGGRGDNQGEFNGPIGIAVDATGNVFIADTNNHRIQKFSSTGTFLSNFGKFGGSNGELKEPNAVATDAGGNVYVADTWNHRIQKFKSDGSFLLKWNGPEPGFFGPRDITVGPDNVIYVLDTGNGKVHKYTTEGKYLGGWGNKGANDGEMSGPTGIALNGSTVYIADTDNHRIQVFSDGGVFRRKWTVEEWELAGWEAPRLTFDAGTRRLYATSTVAHQVLVFDPNGKKLGTLSPKPPETLSGPTGICQSKDGGLFVVDSYENRIYRLQYPK